MAEKEYIELNEAVKACEDYFKDVCVYDVASYEAVDDFERILDSIPVVDVAPVKHGHWVYNQNGHDWGLGAWECSLCHSVNNNLPIDKRFSPYVYAGSKYCPNCGAKMNGGNDNDR